MLTALSLVMPNFKDSHYAILAEWALAKAEYYSDNDELEKSAYWTKQACKYVLKRIDLLKARGL